MDVILLEKIRRLGDMGETVKVKPGYGRNFLLPQGKALPATDANRAVFEARKTELTKRAAESVNAAKIRAEKIAGQVLNIKVLASEEGKLYGSVNVSEVLDAANEAGLDIERNEIVMPTPIREIGRFDIAISLHSEVETSITVVVESKRAAQNDD
ncbi:MAG: 50S ribosomal protein L9 [Polycyclovorans sp.]|jgi:large subunit ribosomal protein L9|nr:50S ribosomal protein L9 [Polycyclovorans sp.]MBU0791361.1 50S ribosomal protein L9 [Gammaproteobacteria bacterium]MDP1542276.1 50S ribosomal protein L9 [Polycyclovorans sp.]MEC8848022.1 50S ribosomal protein L9 [Pseudomonadota bacterium]|tara:strand:- start:38597 stop:39061 length:465 start_codon:yes stop_codon:yes gene_type:complete